MAKHRYWIRHVADAQEATRVCRKAAESKLGLLEADQGKHGVWLVFRTSAPIVTLVLRVHGDQNAKPAGHVPQDQRAQPAATEVANREIGRGMELRRLISADARTCLMFFGPVDDAQLAQRLSEPEPERRPAKPPTPPPPPRPTSTEPVTPEPPALEQGEQDWAFSGAAQGADDDEERDD